MQKDVFDDIFDTTDEDEDDARKAAEEAPLIPTPVGFQPDCSILDNVSILFLNNKILLELRKTWRFLYSSKTSDRDFVELSKSIQYEGPTLIVVRTTNDTILGKIKPLILSMYLHFAVQSISNSSKFLSSLFQKSLSLFSKMARLAQVHFSKSSTFFLKKPLLI